LPGDQVVSWSGRRESPDHPATRPPGNPDPRRPPHPATPQPRDPV